MVDVSDRVRRAWCDYDHPDGRRDHLRSDGSWARFCPHGRQIPWKEPTRTWGLEDWLTLLAFVADRAGDKYWWDLHISGVDDEFDFYIHGGIDEGFTGEQKGLFEFSPRQGQELREAVIRAIDAILDHAQEGDE